LANEFGGIWLRQWVDGKLTLVKTVGPKPDCCQYELKGATIRIGDRELALRGNAFVSEVKPPAQPMPIPESWSSGTIAVPVDAETAASLTKLVEELLVEWCTVLEGPHCTRGTPRFRGTVQEWLEFRKVFETKFVHGEQGASCNE
jgi:hypothetical protein